MINEILYLNGYGIYIWSAYIFTLISFSILHYSIKHSLRKREKSFVKNLVYLIMKKNRRLTDKKLIENYWPKT